MHYIAALHTKLETWILYLCVKNIINRFKIMNTTCKYEWINVVITHIFTIYLLDDVIHELKWRNFLLHIYFMNGETFWFLSILCTTIRWIKIYKQNLIITVTALSMIFITLSMPQNRVYFCENFTIDFYSWFVQNSKHISFFLVEP